MKHVPSFLVALLLCLGLGSPACAQAQEGKPWALRDFYTLQFGPTAFTYDVQTSDWQIEIDERGFLFENVHAEVVLGDGKTLRLAAQQLDHDEREPFEDYLGQGTAFRSVYKAVDGLALRYSMNQYSNRSFIVLRIELRNEGTQPIAVAAVRPAVMNAGSITDLARTAHLEPLYVSQRGGMPLLDDNDGASLLQFALSDPRASIALGMLPTDTCRATISLDRSSDSWTAAASAVYSPSVVLGPGEAMAADPLWIGISQGDIAQLRDVYTWSRSVGPSMRIAWETPPTWVSISPTESVGALYSAAKSWRQYNIRNALVPAGWEDKPGSHRPKTPQFPSDLREVVNTLKGAGVEAGLACDPLAAGNSKSTSALTAQDGTRWFLPKSQEAAQDAVEHASSLTNMGFSFFVVAPSRIPDDVLSQARLTRAEADLIAFRVMVEAAGTKPVVPSAAMTLHDEVDRWQLAALATTGYPQIGLVPGPVRLDAAKISNVTPALIAAIDGYLGPIEIVGVPDSKLQKAIGPTLGDPQWRRQLDAYRNPNLRADR